MTGAVCALAVAFAGGCVPAGEDISGAAGSSGTAGVTGQAGTTTVGTAGTGAACTVAPSMKLAWSMGRDSTGTGLTCQQAGAVTIDVFIDSTLHEFPCANSPAVLTP